MAGSNIASNYTGAGGGRSLFREQKGYKDIMVGKVSMRHNQHFVGKPIMISCTDAWVMGNPAIRALVVVHFLLANCAANPHPTSPAESFFPSAE